MPDLVLKADPNGPARRMIIISFKLAKLTFSEQPKPGSTSASGVEVPELILETGETIKYTSAILRYIGRVVSGSLGGESFLDEAFVDEWLEIVDSKLLPAVLKGDDASGVETVSALLEEALKSRKFLGGELSVADVAAAVLLEGCAGKLSSAGSSWLERVLDHEAFRSTAPASLGGTSGSPSGATSSVAVPAQSVKAPVAEFSSGGRTRLAAVLLAPDGGKSMTGSVVTVCGWSRTIRKQKQFCFVELTDGSCVPNLQCVVDAAMPEFEKLTKCGTGCSFRFKGTLIESPAKGQAVELTVKDPELHSMQIYGSFEAAGYPISKAHHSVEFLREIAHLRPRSNLIGAVARLRSAMAMATHRFFQDRGFLYVHTPILTANDCEGAGEMFQVTTLLPPVDEKSSEKPLPVDEKTGLVDYSKDFFHKPAFLTVSGQLAVENYCCALSDVYTFGPTFRAEKSYTRRHLAEFWMIEPELAFADLNDDMDCAEAYLKFCVQYALDNCKRDLEFFDLRVENGLIQRLQDLVSKPFARVPYTEAVEMLMPHAANFEDTNIHWGMDMGSEHERFLTETLLKQPAFVYNYPKEIKAFYMRRNEDGKTVAAMDLLVPKIGEVIGGSQREERLEELDKAIEEKGLEKEAYWWYRDLRRFGTVPHSGFGLGFERLLMLISGVENIKDVIPFPRSTGSAEF